MGRSRCGSLALPLVGWAALVVSACSPQIVDVGASEGASAGSSVSDDSATTAGTTATSTATVTGTAGASSSGCVMCGNACVDLNDNGLHCGSCGSPCGPTEQCVAGECVADPCGCDAEAELCVDGSCVCKPGLLRCGPVCVEPEHDVQHCGGCGEACDEDDFCIDGECASSDDCEPPLKQCMGECVNTDHDSLHCGSCGVKCGADSICVDGGCVDVVTSDCEACPCPSCPPTHTCCDLGLPRALCVAGDQCPPSR